MSKLFLVLIAGTMPIEINLGGRLMIADLVCVFALSYGLLTSAIPRVQRGEIILYILAVLWLFGQVCADIINSIPANDYARGWSRIVFFIINFSAVRYVVRNSLERASFFLLLVSLGAALKFAIGTGNIEKTGVFALDWKFGYGAALTVAILYLGSKVSRNHSGVIAGFMLTVTTAMIHLALNARSLFGLTTLSAFVGLLVDPASRRKLSAGLLVLVVVVGAIVGAGAVYSYKFAASHGLLGIEAQQKYFSQSNNDLGLIYSGRTELLGSLDAIADSPILGYGSYARHQYYSQLRYARLREAGILVPPPSDDRIPTHSFIFGAWVEAGFIGALFWFWILILGANGLIKALRSPDANSSLAVYACISLIWDVLFSPFGLDRRIVTPSMICVAIIVVSRSLRRTEVVDHAD